MARPKKTGLDYFPFDVHFFSDPKIAAISGEFGIKGGLTVIKLLCAVYRNGYFILWDDLQKMILLNDLPGVSAELLENIVDRLVRWGFFDKNLFDSEKVLTSRGIQKRYFSIVKRRHTDDDFKYLLEDVRDVTPNSGVNVYNNPLTTGLMSTKSTQRKGKESKENISTDVDIQKSVPNGTLPSSPSPYQNDFSMLDLATCVAKCLEAEIWLESVQMQLGILKPDIESKLSAFTLHLKTIGKDDRRALNDFKAHFISWLRIQLSRNNEKNANKPSIGGGYRANPEAKGF